MIHPSCVWTSVMEQLMYRILPVQLVVSINSLFVSCDDKTRCLDACDVTHQVKQKAMFWD